MARKKQRKSGCQINLTTFQLFTWMFKPFSDLLNIHKHPNPFENTSLIPMGHKVRTQQRKTYGKNSQARSNAKPATSPSDFMHFLAQHVQGHMAAQCHLRDLPILQAERDLVTGPMQRDVVQHIPSHETLDDTREPPSFDHPLLLKKKNKSSPNGPYLPEDVSL